MKKASQETSPPPNTPPGTVGPGANASTTTGRAPFAGDGHGDRLDQLEGEVGKLRQLFNRFARQGKGDQ